MSISQWFIIASVIGFVSTIDPGNKPASYQQTSGIRIATEKELLLPAKVYRVPDNNNYDSDTSEFSFKRSIQSPNIAIFWSKEFGQDPMTNPNPTKRFNVQDAIKELERFYEYYVNTLKFLQKGQSLSDKYKVVLYVIGGNENTAFGGGVDNKIGALWTPAVRMSKAPYGALAHELGHSFQYLARADNNGKGPGGSIMEMSAQYLLWQVYPEWMTFENYHLVSYLQKTHFAFLHPTNMYHSPYVIEYWSNKHGKEFFGKLFRATENNEDLVATYKRINNLNQDQFCDEMFDAAQRFMTWDMPRIEEVAKPYANKHNTKLSAVNDGWYRVDSANCPQNYGYNGIPLAVPSAGTTIQLQFKGIAGETGYNAVKTDKAGWRYGFVAHLENGKRVYSKAFKDANGSVSFKVPANTSHLWLVVSGAPTEHWPIATGRARRDANGNTPPPPKEEQWPYEIKLSGTTIKS
jgi:hypothetical protein